MASELEELQYQFSLLKREFAETRTFALMLYESIAKVRWRIGKLEDPEADKVYAEAIKRYAEGPLYRGLQEVRPAEISPKASDSQEMPSADVPSEAKRRAPDSINASVRAWAKAQGVTVSRKGRIPAQIRAKYEAAQAVSDAQQ